MVEISELINPRVLEEKWVGFFGDSEFEDKNGELQMGCWNFTGILKDEDIESIDKKYGIFSLDDEIEEEDIFDNENLIPVWDKNRQFVACIKILY